MAGQDFARVKAPKQKQEADHTGRSMATVLGVIFTAIVCFATGYWLGGAQGGQLQGADAGLAAIQARLDEKTAQLRLQQARIEELEESIVQWKNRVERKASDRLGELQFYENLPRQSVTPAPISGAASAAAAGSPAKAEAAKPAAVADADAPAAAAVAEKPAAAAGVRDSYRLQIISYREKSDAVTFQRKLFNAGFSASIQPVDLPDNGRWYRVYAGPYSGRAAAEKARKDIRSAMKIRGLLIRER